MYYRLNSVVYGSLFYFKGGINVYTIAWICFILSCTDCIYNLLHAIVANKISDRVGSFVGSIVFALPVYFFYMYLFGR